MHYILEVGCKQRAKFDSYLDLCLISFSLLVANQS